MIIYLGPQLPKISCGQPGSDTRRAASSSLFNLAPDGVYLAD